MLWRISRRFLNEQLPGARGEVLFWISLCNLCVLCVSVVSVCHQLLNHRDTEDTEVAQRNPHVLCVFVASFRSTMRNSLILTILVALFFCHAHAAVANPLARDVTIY